MRTFLRPLAAALLLALLTLTAACGNKGELVRPGAPPAAAQG
jgi:predicted small lipoprotein YifL